MASDPATTIPAGTQINTNHLPNYNCLIRRINKTEMVKLIFLTGAAISLLMTAPATYRNLISEGYIYKLIISDFCAILFLTTALYLQFDYPEVALISMILGSLLVIGAVHAIMLSVLPEGMRWPVLVAFSGYVVVLCFVMYRIRVSEDEDEDEYCKDRGVDPV